MPRHDPHYELLPLQAGDLSADKVTRPGTFPQRLQRAGIWKVVLILFILVSSAALCDYILELDYLPLDWHGDDDDEESILHKVDASLPTVPGWKAFRDDSGPLIDPPRTPDPSQRLLSAACADLFVAKGILCKQVTPKVVRKAVHGSIEVVVTWINGSDPLLADWRNRVALQDEQRSGSGEHSGLALKHFREHNELLYNLRSQIDALPLEAVTRIRIAATDVDAKDEEHADLRLGQVPRWLDLETLDGAATTDCPTLSMLFQRDVFRLSSHSRLAADANAWREASTPSFNSMAIESQLTNLRTSAAYILDLNDDAALLSKLEAADLATPLYGPMIRFYKGGKVKARPWGESGMDVEGEWPSLEYSNYLMDQRFGKRERTYIMHIFKVFPVHLLHELGLVFPDAMAETALARYRGRGPEINLGFMASNFLMARHREALLWSLLIAKHDLDQSDTFSRTEQVAVVAFFRSSAFAESNVSIAIRFPQRASNSNHARLLKQAGLAKPRLTRLDFTSQDGYPLSELSGLPQSSLPVFKNPVLDKAVCEISFDTCLNFGTFGAAFGDADAIAWFKHVAFEEPRCGDCMIAAALVQSGALGLEGFLPPPDPAAKTADATERLVPPMLAPTSTLEAADYSWRTIQAQLGSFEGLRDFCVRLIQRYAFVAGYTYFEFQQITDVAKLPGQLSRLEHMRGTRIAYLGYNDDIADPAEVPRIDRLLNETLDQIWPKKLPWEMGRDRGWTVW